MNLIAENRTAHTDFARADEAAVEARIKNSQAKLKYEEVKSKLEKEYKEFLKSDPIGANSMIRERSAEEFAAWVRAETYLWLAELEYRKAGYRVDCIAKEIELRKAAMGEV